MSLKKAVYAGTFDPFTIGHFSIVKKALNVFDEIVIVVAVPPGKKAFIEADKRVELIKAVFSNDKRVSVDSHGGLLVDYCKNIQVYHLVRGLRPTGDFEPEFQMATMNAELCDKVETVFLITDPENSFVSSSLVREIFSHGGDISPFVPKNISEYLINEKK